jgi:hypothetical protein
MISQKTTYFTLCWALLLLLLLAVGCGQKAETTAVDDDIVQDSVPSLVMQIQKCSKLYTTEIKVHKIVTHDDVVRLKGNLMRKNFNIALPLGERKIAIPMDATLKAYIDFADFSEENIERDGDKITILLPDPKVVLTSSKIDQKEVKSFVGLTRSHFTDKEMSDYEQQGRQAILDRIKDLGVVETAQENAARVLVPMVAQMGYKEENITIAFRKNLDYRKLIDANIEKK